MMTVEEAMNSSDMLILALNKFGVESQINQTKEECAELIVALSHYERMKCDDDAVVSELVDVQIMLYQMTKVFGVKKFQAEFKAKMERLASLLQEVEE